MPQVSFKAKGRKNFLCCQEKRKKPMKQLTAYQKHIRRGMEKEKKRCDKAGTTMDAAKTMKKLAKSWRG